MPVTADTLERARRARIAVDRRVDDVTRDLVGAWGRAWGEVVGEYREAIEDLIKRSEKGWPPRHVIDRASRAQRAVNLAARHLDDLGKQPGIFVSNHVGDLVHEAQRWHESMAESQLPRGGFGAVRASFDSISEEAIEAIVKRTIGQVEALSRPLSLRAQQVMKRELIRGVAVGSNPRVAARRMINRLEGAFNGGLGRAQNIARTEMLSAHREASQQIRKANADVLKGWTWQATLDRRTCPSCLSQHGSFHPVGELGPLDHQQGRCTALPITKSWTELGFDGVPEPPSFDVPSAQAWFDSQLIGVQRSIMGSRRLELYKQGKVKWSQLSARRRNKNWRDSFGTPTLKALGLM